MAVSLRTEGLRRGGTDPSAAGPTQRRHRDQSQSTTTSLDDAPSPDLLRTQILNVLVWIFFFGSNLYSALGGPSTGYNHGKQTYAQSTTPSGIGLAVVPV